MYKRILTLFRSSTARDSGILLVGTVLASGFGFLATLFLAPRIGVADFGVYITALSFTQLVCELFELGIGASTMKFVSGQKKDVGSYLSNALYLRLISSVTIGLVLLIFAPIITQLVFKSRNLESFVFVSSGGVVLFMLISWGLAVLQAKGKFLQSMIGNVSINVFRLLAILFLLQQVRLNSQTAFISSQIVLVFSAAVILFFLGKEVFRRPFSHADVKRLFQFGLPIGLGTSVAALYSRLDQIFVFRQLGETQAGVFGLASRISTLFIFASYALSSATIPRFVGLNSEQFRQYFLKTCLATLALCGLALCALVTSPFLIPLFFGQEYLGAILPFQILSIGTCFFMFSLLLQNAVVFQYQKNHFPLQLSLFSLVFLFIAINVGISKLGIVGAAAAVSITYALQATVSLWYFCRLHGWSLASLGKFPQSH